jgi:hypothetical protein
MIPLRNEASGPYYSRKIGLFYPGSIRSDVMAHTRYEALKEFVDAVEPFFSDIKDWCDDYFGKPDVPDEVFLF